MSLSTGLGGGKDKNCISPALFFKWAKQNEIFVHPDVDVFHCTPEMGGVGVFARKNLPPGTVVLSTPSSAAISPYSEPHPRLPSIVVLQTPSRENGAPLVRRDPVLAVILRLMAECCKGKSSLFHPWLQHCPDMRAHLFDLTENEKKIFGITNASTETCVKGKTEIGPAESQWTRWTGVSQQLRDLRVDERWSLAQSEILIHHPEIWPPKKATFSLFCQCMAHVFSRNFHREEMVGREGPYLLPVLDFLNHAEPPNTKFEVRGGGRKHGTAFTVVTSESVKSGEQVFATYGSIGSSRFAVEFQFISSDIIRKDLCRFSCEQFVEMAVFLLAKSNESSTGVVTECDKKEVSRRVEILQRLGLLYDEGLYLKGNGYYRGDNNCCREKQDQRENAPLPIPFVEPEGSQNTVTPQMSWSAEEQVREWTRFRNVVFLLLLPTRESFEEYYHRDVSAHWEAPVTPLTTKGVRDFLQLRLHAIRNTWQAVQQTFAVQLSDGCEALPLEGEITGKRSKTHEPTVALQRVDLLRCALGSEEGIVLEHLEMASG